MAEERAKTETFTILTDDEARREARAYRRLPIFTNNPLPEAPWKLPSIDNFLDTERKERNHTFTPSIPTVAWYNAVLGFRSETLLKNIDKPGDGNLTTADLLHEVARSWSIASDPGLEGSTDQPGWALRSGPRNRTTKLETVIFPLCTIKRERGFIEVGILPFRPLSGTMPQNPPSHVITIFLFDPRLRGATHVRVKRPRARTTALVTTPARAVADERDALNIALSTEQLSPADEEALKNYLFQRAVRSNIQNAATALADPLCDDAVRASYVAALANAFHVAARLDRLAISRADEKLVQLLLAGDPLPNLPALQTELGYPLPEATELAAIWDRLDPDAGATSPTATLAATGALALTGASTQPKHSYRPLDLAQLLACRPCSRAFNLVALYTKNGGQDELQACLQNILGALCNDQGGGAAKWLGRHATALSPGNPQGGARLGVTEGMLISALALANDYRAHDAVDYLKALQTCDLQTAEANKKQARGKQRGKQGAKPRGRNLMSPTTIRWTLDLCRMLNRPNGAAVESDYDMQPSTELLTRALSFSGIVKQLITRVPDATALRVFALAVSEARTWRSLSEAALDVPAASAQERDESIRDALEACKPLVEHVEEIERESVRRTVLKAALALAYLAGDSPAWLSDAMRAARGALLVDSGPWTTSIYPLWKRRNPDEPITAYACEAIVAGRSGFAAAELERADSNNVQEARDALLGVARVQSTVAALMAHETPQAEIAVREALVEALRPLNADPDPLGSNLAIIRIMALCAQRHPGAIPPTAEQDPTAFELLYERARLLLCNAETLRFDGINILAVLCAAGARTARYRAEAAILGSYAQYACDLNIQLQTLIRRSAQLSGIYSVADAIAPAVYACGSMEAVRERCHELHAFVAALPGFKGEGGADDTRQTLANNAVAVETSAAPQQDNDTVGDSRHTPTEASLERALAAFIQDPALHTQESPNPARRLHRILTRRDDRDAAGALAYSYVSPHQLSTLAQELQWRYAENVDRDPETLARELPARATLMTEYLENAFDLAHEQSRRSHDLLANAGLDFWCNAIGVATNALKELRLLRRGLGQEEPLAKLTASLSATAKRIASDPNAPGGMDLENIALWLSHTVAAAFPETVCLTASLQDVPAPILIDATIRLVRDGNAGRSSRSLEIQKALAELDGRVTEHSLASDIAGACEWLVSIVRASQTENKHQDATRSPLTACALELLAAGVHGSSQQQLTRVTPQLAALHREHGVSTLSAIHLVLRFWKTFQANPVWCLNTIQYLLDDYSTPLLSDVLQGIAEIADAAADEASSAARREAACETAEVAWAFRSQDPAASALAREQRAPGRQAESTYGTAARQALDALAATVPELVPQLTNALLFRRMDPLVSAVAHLDTEQAIAAARALNPVVRTRSSYLCRAVLKEALGPVYSGEQPSAGLTAFASELPVDRSLVAPISTENTSCDWLSVLLREISKIYEEQTRSPGSSLGVLLQEIVQLCEAPDLSTTPRKLRSPRGERHLETELIAAFTTAARIAPPASDGTPSRLTSLVGTIARLTLPATSRLEAAQQLLFQNRMRETARIAPAFSVEENAYLTLARELTRSNPSASNDLAAAAKTLSDARGLPVAFRRAARTLCEDAARPRPQPLRPRFSAMGCFEDFAYVKHDENAQTQLMQTQLIDTARKQAATARSLLTQKLSAEKSSTNALGVEQHAAQTAIDDAYLQAIDQLDALLGTTQQELGTSSLPAQYLAMLLGVMSLASNPSYMLCYQGASETARAVARLRTCLEETPLTDAEQALALGDANQQETLARIANLLERATNVTAGAPTAGAATGTVGNRVDATGDGITRVHRLRAPLAAALDGITTTTAAFLMHCMMDALIPSRSSQYGALSFPRDAEPSAKLCRNLTACMDIVARVTTEANEAGGHQQEALGFARCLGGATNASCESPRLRAWFDNAQDLLNGDAYHALGALDQLVRFWPEQSIYLSLLADCLEEAREFCASCIEVRIENRELDGGLSLLARNHSASLDTSLSVVALDIVPPTGAPQHINLVGETAEAARVDLPAYGEGITWTPLRVPLDVPDSIEAATVTAHLSSAAGNKWTISTDEPLPRAITVRSLGDEPLYPETARLTGTHGKLIGRENELGTIRSKLSNLASRLNGLKMVGAKGVGKTAIASEIMSEQLTAEGDLANCFAATSCVRGTAPAVLLYNLLIALHRALAKRPDAADVVVKQIETLEQHLDNPSASETPTLASLRPFTRDKITTGLASLEQYGVCATFVVDEAQELLAYDADELDALQGIIAGTNGIVSWLFVGTGDLVDLDRTGAAPAGSLFVSARTLHVGHFPPDTRADILKCMLHNPAVLGTGEGSLRFTDDAIAYLADYTDGHARPALKLANDTIYAVRRAADGEQPTAHPSPFALPTKRYVYASDLSWVLAGGGARQEDETAYSSIKNDFSEIKNAPGVETALRALLKLSLDHIDEPATEEVTEAASLLERIADTPERELTDTVIEGLRILTSHGFITREAVDNSAQYRFSSPLYSRFARFLYQENVTDRLRDIEREGHVSKETLAAEEDKREHGLLRLFGLEGSQADLIQRNIELKAELKLTQEERERAEQRAANAMRSTQQVVVNQAGPGGTVNLASGQGATAGGEHVHGNVANVSIGQMNVVNITTQQLRSINETVASALQGSSDAPQHAAELVATLPWPTDYRYLRAAAMREAAFQRELKEEARLGAGQAGAIPDAATTPGDDEPPLDSEQAQDESRQSFADAAYADQFAQAGEQMWGTSARELGAWLDVPDNQRILGAVGITWNGSGNAGNNPLLAQALEHEHPDDDLLRTCRSVCIAAMIYELLYLTAYDNFSPVATLIAQETEHLWKHRLMPAIIDNPRASLILVDWDRSGGFDRRRIQPARLWAGSTARKGQHLIDRAELGKFWRLGSHGITPSFMNENPWDRLFPQHLLDKQQRDQPYQLGPAYNELSEETLKGMAGDGAAELWAAYDHLAYYQSERLNGPIRCVNNLDVLARALVDADDHTGGIAAEAELQACYGRLVRYFTGVACVRSLRNHAAHGESDTARSPFDQRCAALLFAATASDETAGEELDIPAITFATTWKSSSGPIPWSTVGEARAEKALPVNPLDHAGAYGGVLLETARMAERLRNTAQA